MAPMPILLAGLSALMYGFADFSGGYASSKSHVLSVVVVSQAVGLLVALACLALEGTPFPGAADAAWGVCAGLMGALGLITLYRGLASGIVAIVSPVSALVSAILPAIYGLAAGERLSGLTLAGSALCVPAILLLSWGGPGGGDRKAVRSAFLQGALAGLGFGGFFIAVSRTSPDSGLWPLVASRAASIAVVIAAMAVTHRSLKLERASRASALGSGLADMGANIFFLLASRSGLLSLVSVVSSLYPAPTVILGRLFLKQRIPPVRAAGLLLALAGVALISVK
jgi:drug/metabolite transporter (DMT)-like permease